MGHNLRVGSLGLGVLVSAGSAAARPAEEIRDRTPNVLLADLGLHVLGVGLQRTLGPRLAVQLALDSYTPWTQNENLFGLSGARHEGDVTGAVVRGRFFFYPRAKPPTGLWLSPFAQVGPAWATVGDETRVGTVWAAGLSAGYGWLFSDVWNLGLGAGAQYHAADFDGGTDGPSYGRWYPTLDAIVGYCF